MQPSWEAPECNIESWMYWPRLRPLSTVLWYIPSECWFHWYRTYWRCRPSVGKPRRWRVGNHFLIKYRNVWEGTSWIQGLTYMFYVRQYPLSWLIIYTSTQTILLSKIYLKLPEEGCNKSEILSRIKSQKHNGVVSLCFLMKYLKLLYSCLNFSHHLLIFTSDVSRISFFW